MKKILLSFLLLPISIPSLVSSNATVKNIIRSEAEGGSVEVNSSTTVTVNGKSVTVQTDKPGEIEINAGENQVEIKTSNGITPTIIITGVPTPKEGQTPFSKIVNNRSPSIYSFLKGLFSRVFRSFLKKT